MLFLDKMTGKGVLRMRQILLLEDDMALGQGIRFALQNNDVAVTLCATLVQARQALEDSVFDLLVLDVNLPDGSGLELLQEGRRSRLTPIILLTANDMETDIVTGLESGADDYITKPFSLAVLRARVNAQLRRQAGGEQDLVELDGFTFHFSRMEFKKDGHPVELSKTEQKLLRLLVSNRGATLSRGTLVDRLWTDGAEYVEENALSVTIKRLRNKLEDNPSKPKYLKTVYGVGYTWAVK